MSDQAVPFDRTTPRRLGSVKNVLTSEVRWRALVLIGFLNVFVLGIKQGGRGCLEHLAWITPRESRLILGLGPNHQAMVTGDHTVVAQDAFDHEPVVESRILGSTG